MILRLIEALLFCVVALIQVGLLLLEVSGLLLVSVHLHLTILVIRSQAALSLLRQILESDDLFLQVFADKAEALGLVREGRESFSTTF